MKRLIICLSGLAGLVILLASPSYSNSIEELNAVIQAEGARWVAKVTPVSNIPKEEMGKWAEALEPLDVSDMPVDSSFYIPLSVPPSFDWTDNNGNFVTSIKNQSSPNFCGSCFVFAPVAALESKVLISNGMPWVDLNLSEQIVLSCSGGGTCEEGGLAAFDKVYDFLKNTGTYLERCYVYTATNGECGRACANWETYAYKIDGWSIVVNGNKGLPSLSAIKNAVYAAGPVVAMMKLYDDFRHYGAGVYSYTSGNYIGKHWVLIVGWDDTEEAFKCKNSWGTEWGEEGFFWISYNELYGTGTAEFGKWVCALGDVLQSPITNGPDLTGEWKSLTQACKLTGKKKSCKIAGSLQITNIGNQVTPSSSVEIYISDGQNYLKRISIPKLKVGGNKLLKLNYTLPSGQNASGKDIIAVIDPDDTIVETNEGNNIVIYGPIP